MVQASFFVTLAAILSIASTVQALPVAIEARDESDSVLEARMFKKIATEIGKEAYQQAGNAILHGGPSIANPHRSNNSPFRGQAARPPTSGHGQLSTLGRPSALRPHTDPIRTPNMGQRQSIGPVSQALKGKTVNWGGSHSDPSKFGHAKESHGTPSPKHQVGGKPKSHEAPF